MPELPEVETVRIGLARLLPGRIIKSVVSDTDKSFPNAPGDVQAFLLGASVTAVRRRAKVLLIDLDMGYTLVTHLKMTGQLVFVANKKSPVTSRQSSAKTEDKRQVTEDTSSDRFGAGHPNDSLIGKLPDKSTRVTLTFSDDSQLFFNDQRKFGWMRLLPTIEVPNIDFMKKVGPEPLEDDFTADVFIARLQRRKNSNIKAVLLDQTVLAGVGNIYADESLWSAKIHPTMLVRNIPNSKLTTLHSELLHVLRLSIEKGGSTDRNYVNAEGKKGSYISFAKVFRKEGTPCQRCGTIIIKTRVAGRGTHVCPTCQVAISS